MKSQSGRRRREFRGARACSVGLLGICAAVVSAGPVDVSEAFPINNPHGMAGVGFYDGALYAISKDNLLIKYDLATGEQLEVVNPLISGPPPIHLHGIAVEAGGTFWVIDTISWRLFQLSFADYSVLSTIDAPAGQPPYGLAFADELLWVGHHSDGPPTAVESVDPQSGEILQAFEFGVADNHGMAWVGDYLWALDNVTDELYQVDETGQLRDSFALPQDSWHSLAYDGTDFWANNRTTFLKLHVSPPLCPPPAEVPDVKFTGETTVSWQEPSRLGGGPVVYDMLRSDDPADFMALPRCIESNDGSDMTATDRQTPAPAIVFHYLVRAENSCPSGVGPLGSYSSGQDREGPDCP